MDNLVKIRVNTQQKNLLPIHHVNCKWCDKFLYNSTIKGTHGICEKCEKELLERLHRLIP